LSLFIISKIFSIKKLQKLLSHLNLKQILKRKLLV